MNILITGVAGFIGASCAIGLLNKNHNIFGIDNFDSYYSPKLKKFRIKELKKYKNFEFKLIDINNKSKLLKYLKKKKINIIVHLAAQAGVRHSFKNPSKYIDVNIFGFLNIIHAAKSNNIKKIIYASSSSVYGENSNFPIVSVEFIGTLNNSDNLIFGFGLGAILRNDEWIAEYLITPMTFLYRKNLDDSFMFYDVGVSSAIMGTIQGDQVLSVFYPEFGIGLRINKKNSLFFKNFRFCFGYNLIDRSNEYYPNGLIWKYVVGFTF